MHISYIETDSGTASGYKGVRLRTENTGAKRKLDSNGEPIPVPQLWVARVDIQKAWVGALNLLGFNFNAGGSKWSVYNPVNKKKFFDTPVEAARQRDFAVKYIRDLVQDNGSNETQLGMLTGSFTAKQGPQKDQAAEQRAMQKKKEEAEALEAAREVVVSTVDMMLGMLRFVKLNTLTSEYIDVELQLTGIGQHMKAAPNVKTVRNASKKLQKIEKGNRYQQMVSDFNLKKAEQENANVVQAASVAAGTAAGIQGKLVDVVVKSMTPVATPVKQC